MEWRKIIGWLAVVLSTLLASFWAFWGSIENFQEGWYHTSLWANLAMGDFSFRAVKEAK